MTAPASAARSRSWPEPSRTLCGIGSSSAVSSVSCCASTTLPSRPPSLPGPTVCVDPRPVNSSRPPRCRLGPHGWPAPKSRPCSSASAASAASMPRPSVSARPSAPNGRTSRRWSRTRSASKCSPFSSSWTPPAPPPNNSSKRWKKPSPQHPDVEILLSFPGLGIQLADRVLAETGDDRGRFADACGLKACPGSSPITGVSDKKSAITRRWVKNNRLNHADCLFSGGSRSRGYPRQSRRRASSRVRPCSITRTGRRSPPWTVGGRSPRRCGRAAPPAIIELRNGQCLADSRSRRHLFEFSKSRCVMPAVPGA